jgi:thioesterase domain-containing protein
MPSAEDFRWARQRRAAVRTVGGILDLLLPLRASGSGYPLFCVFPIMGLSWCYLALVPHISAEHPLFGVQARGLRRPEPLPTSMTEMARDAADQIRAAQPAGPYHLLGWSLGGNIAFAVAQELEQRGHEVGLLAILDASPRIPDNMTAGDDGAWLLYNFVLSEFGYQPVLAADEPDPAGRLLELIRARPGLGLDEWPDRRVLALLRVTRNVVAVARAHRPGRVQCPLLFFSAARTPPGLTEKLARWRPFTNGPIDAVELDCQHAHLMLPEPVARIGATLTERMAATATVTAAVPRQANLGTSPNLSAPANLGM